MAVGVALHSFRRAPCCSAGGDRVVERVAEPGERVEQFDLLVDLAVDGQDELADVVVAEPRAISSGSRPACRISATAVRRSHLNW